MKLVKLLANLGYGSRKEVQRLIRSGAVTDDTGRQLSENEVPAHERIRFRGEELDPPSPLVLMLNKPCGYTCGTDDPGAVIYDLLPERFGQRNPALSPVGRLDKDTSGLLLFTDDGQLLHRLTSPKHHQPKVYRATLADDLRGTEAALFAAGTLLLEGEHKPLLPAELDVLGPREARLTLHEGRYHQVRRMFAATGNAVVTLHREAIGGLSLGRLSLAPGEWRMVTAEERAQLGA